MLQAYIFEDRGNLNQHLPLIELACNNNHHSNIKMAPYKALYSRKFRILIYQVEVGDKRVLGPKVVQETTDKIKEIQEKSRRTHSRQKSMQTDSEGHQNLQKETTCFFLRTHNLDYLFGCRIGVSQSYSKMLMNQILYSTVGDRCGHDLQVI